jgi:AcrR family transcriptional regulator
MDKRKTGKSRPAPPRVRVLAAAERLLAAGSEGFSMRELAEAAEVSFATPFNQFGSKAAIMRALSERRIALMHERLAAAAGEDGNAAMRAVLAARIAAQVMLEDPVVNRAVMAVLGAPAQPAGGVMARSRALWAAALGRGDGLLASSRQLACRILPDQLAFAFRGVFSFWTAGDIPDDALVRHAQAAAAALLLGLATQDTRTQLLAVLEPPAVR